MKSISLHWKIIIGMLMGIAWSVFASIFGFSNFTIKWISPFGDIFINLLKLIAVPLVLFSVIKGVSSISNISLLGKMGLKTLMCYLFSTVIAITIGLSLVNLIKPGTYISIEQRKINHESFIDFKENGVISNDFLSEKIKQAEKQKNTGPMQFIVDMVPSNIFLSLTNNKLMLQIIFFAIFFGVVMVMIPKEQSFSIINLIDSLNSIFLKMVEIVMSAAPFFVFALLAGVMAKIAGDNPSGVIEIFKGLGIYSLVVITGLLIMIFMVYPLVIVIIKKSSYNNFFKSIAPAQMLAFSTSSSAATLPVTMDCVNNNLSVPKRISNFVLPIGATVNMDGTSLYQAVAVVFLAQMHMVDLTISNQLLIIFTATMASIGSAAVPSAGLIMLIIVLDAVGLNPAWISIIFPVDRILDMCRTVVNVTGDATVASVISQIQQTD